MSIHLNPDNCLACTTCVVHCPVAAATPAFSGPRMIGPGFERFRLLGLCEDRSLTYCANCKNCEIACPQNVPVATINMLARFAQCREEPPSFRDWILAHGEIIARFLSFIPARLKNFGMGLGPVRNLLDVIGIAKECPMPSFAKVSLRSLFAHSANLETTKKCLAYFPGCYTNYYDPKTGLDVIWLLRKAGYHVIIPQEFVCCGIPLVSGGFEEDAKKNATINARVLADLAKKGIPVITSCPSCRLMLSREMKELFPEIIDEFGEPVIEDCMDVFTRLVESGELSPNTRERNIEAIYHAPCHLRALGGGLPGFELLASLPHSHLQNANAGCCGISGSYGFKKEKYDIAQKVGNDLFMSVTESKCSLVLSECGTCRLQITGNTNIPSLHPVSVLRSLCA
ncbi:MAG: anaerobic glycerol-3-phosphate dehydrogenase subunit C [Desulfovibrio sp.]|nr:anaerobic glycerol-3-phosphate dehydrogenase subunit C [Desulfovibrio sp.]